MIRGYGHQGLRCLEVWGLEDARVLNRLRLNILKLPKQVTASRAVKVVHESQLSHPTSQTYSPEEKHLRPH